MDTRRAVGGQEIIQRVAQPALVADLDSDAMAVAEERERAVEPIEAWQPAGWQLQQDGAGAMAQPGAIGSIDRGTHPSGSASFLRWVPKRCSFTAKWKSSLTASRQPVTAASVGVR